ncbi:hypothetical protein, partial [Bradyrhizobium guangdongense]|uniref:hypothetical protein n=1 Tax=Bradyrhizobium guangdongense TaxID=1325090 RepID=UPI001FD8F07A
APMARRTMMPGSTIRTAIARWPRSAATETSFPDSPMKPHCPNCLTEMTKASASRNLFSCEPCREIIQCFGGSADHGEPGPQFSWPIRRKRAAQSAHAG